MANLTYQDVKKIIDAKTDEILDMIDLSSSLTAALKRENVITAAVADKLRVASKTDHEKVELILTSIRQRGPESFLKFCKVLNEKDHEHVLKVLGVVVQGNTINVRKVSAKQVQMQTGAVSGQWAAGPTYRAGTASVRTPLPVHPMLAGDPMYLKFLQEIDGRIEHELKHKK